MLWVHFTLSIPVSFYKYSMFLLSTGKDLTPRTPSKFIFKSCGCCCCRRSQWDCTFQTTLFISTVQMRIWYSKVLFFSDRMCKWHRCSSINFFLSSNLTWIWVGTFPRKKILYFEGQIDTLPLNTIQTNEQITGRRGVFPN